jgi:hypothetical protein
MKDIVGIKVDAMTLANDGWVTAELCDGTHNTYRVETVKDGVLNGRRIVSLLTGPDNKSNYVAFGFVNNPVLIHGFYSVYLWRRHDGTAYAEHTKRLNGFTQDVIAWHQATPCCVCGRMLTTPESISKGIGPKCEGRQ